MPGPSRLRSSVAEIPSDPILPDDDEVEQQNQHKSPGKIAGASNNAPSNILSRKANIITSKTGMTNTAKRQLDSKGFLSTLDSKENGKSTPSSDREIRTAEGDNEDNQGGESDDAKGLSEPTGSLASSDGNASDAIDVDADEVQSRAIPRSRPVTRSQARTSKSAKKSTAKPPSSRSSSAEESLEDVQSSSSSSSDLSPVLTRRSRRAAAMKATLKFSNDERADKVLSKLLERAESDADYASILSKWRDPGSRAILINNMEESSASSEEVPAQRKRLTKFQSNSHSVGEAKNLPPRNGSRGDTLSRGSIARGKYKQASLSNILESLRSNRRQSLPLKSRGGTLQARLRNRPALPSRSNQGPSALTAPSTPRKRRAQPAKSSRSTKRKRTSRRHAVEDFDLDEDVAEEDIEIEGETSEESEDVDFAADADEEDELQRDDGTDEEEEEKEEEENEDTSGRSLSRDFEVLEVDEAESEEAVDTESSPKRKGRNSRSAKKRTGRRRRTAPSDVFGTGKSELSETEMRERLEFLLNQSSEISRALHKALAEAPVRHINRGLTQPRTDNGAKDDMAEIPADKDVGNCSENPKSASEEEFVPPNGRGCELQPHQNEGVSWLLKLDAEGLNAILADEMGLGKTIQAVAFLASLIISGSRGPHLIIAPKNVCEHWVGEVRKWYPGQITVVSHLGSAEERIGNLHDTLLDDNFDIMVTSYEIASRDLFCPIRTDNLPSQYRKVLREFRQVEFEYLVIDEAHRLKSDKSRMNQAIRNYTKCQRRLLLTGTPLSNNLQELWCLMNVLNPRIFSSKATFESWFSAPFDNAKGKKREVMTNAEKSLIVDRLHTVLRPFFRRRERKDVCPEYTSADEVIISCPLSALQRSLMHHFQRRASERDAGVSNILMAMRGVSNHPYTTTEAFNEYAESDANPKLVATSGKFSFLHYALPRLIASDHRILIFSQFRAVLDYLEDLLDLLDIKYGRLDGATKSDERLSGIAGFNAEGSEIPVFLLTTRAGGVGLNLQTADTVILFDSDWNPSADLQAVSRIQRIGQKKTVHILRLVSENSIDALIVEVAGRKRRTQEVAVGAGNFHTSYGAARDQKLRQKDLEELLGALEGRKYLDGATSGQDDSSVVPVPSTSECMGESGVDAKIAEWDKKLLRPGEPALSPSGIDYIWIDSTPDSGFSNVPKWLAKDADLVAAARAMRCRDAYQAKLVYDEAVQSRARVGSYAKKERAVRARRQIVIDYSDFESEEDGADGQSDRSVKLDTDAESESDDSIEVVNEGIEKGTSKGASKRASKFSTWAVNLDAMSDDSPSAPGATNNATPTTQPVTSNPIDEIEVVSIGVCSGASKTNAVRSNSDSPGPRNQSNSGSDCEANFITKFTKPHRSSKQSCHPSGSRPQSKTSALENKKAHSNNRSTVAHEKVTLYQRARIPNLSNAHRPALLSPQGDSVVNNHVEPAATQPEVICLADDVLNHTNGPVIVEKPFAPRVPQTITLPMTQSSGKIEQITVEVHLEEAAYREAQQLSVEATRRAVSGDHTGAYIICNQVTALLNQPDLYNEPFTPRPNAQLGVRGATAMFASAPASHHAVHGSLFDSTAGKGHGRSSQSHTMSASDHTNRLSQISLTGSMWNNAGLSKNISSSMFGAANKHLPPLQSSLINHSHFHSPDLSTHSHFTTHQRSFLDQRGQLGGNVLLPRPRYGQTTPVIAPLLSGFRCTSPGLEFGARNAGPVLHSQSCFPDRLETDLGARTAVTTPKGCVLPPPPALPPLSKVKNVDKTVTNIGMTQSKRERTVPPPTKVISFFKGQETSAVAMKPLSNVSDLASGSELPFLPPMLKNDTGVCTNKASPSAKLADISNKESFLKPLVPVDLLALTAPTTGSNGLQIESDPSSIPNNKSLCQSSSVSNCERPDESQSIAGLKGSRIIPLQHAMDGKGGKSEKNGVDASVGATSGLMRLTSGDSKVETNGEKILSATRDVTDGKIVKNAERRDSVPVPSDKEAGKDLKGIMKASGEKPIQQQQQQHAEAIDENATLLVECSGPKRVISNGDKFVSKSVKPSPKVQARLCFPQRRDSSKLRSDSNQQLAKEKKSDESVQNQGDQRDASKVVTDAKCEQKERSCVKKLASGDNTNVAVSVSDTDARRNAQKGPTEKVDLTMESDDENGFSGSELQGMKGSGGLPRRKVVVSKAVRDETGASNGRNLGSLRRQTLVRAAMKRDAKRHSPKAVGEDCESRSKCPDNNGKSKNIDGVNRDVRKGWSEAAEAKCFSDLVVQLQRITKVSDASVLIDALLACDGDLDIAANYVKAQIG